MDGPGDSLHDTPGGIGRSNQRKVTDQTDQLILPTRTCYLLLHSSVRRIINPRFPIPEPRPSTPSTPLCLFHALRQHPLAHHVPAYQLLSTMDVPVPYLWRVLLAISLTLVESLPTT